MDPQPSWRASALAGTSKRSIGPSVEKTWLFLSPLTGQTAFRFIQSSHAWRKPHRADGRPGRLLRERLRFLNCETTVFSKLSGECGMQTVESLPERPLWGHADSSPTARSRNCYRLVCSISAWALSNSPAIRICPWSIRAVEP